MRNDDYDDDHITKRDDVKADHMDMYVIETNVRQSVLQLLEPMMNKIQLEKQNTENLK